MRHFKKKSSFSRMKLFSSIILLFLFSLLPAFSLGELKVHFIDVGQGDSILVECDGSTLLVDAGPLEAGPVVNRYLNETVGISSLDYVVATHEHDDHLFGMPDALSSMSIGKVYAPSTVPMSYWLESILPRLNQANVFEIARPQENETLQLGEAVVTFINTNSELAVSNDKSLVLRIDYGKTSVLLTGDIEGEAETKLLADKAPLKADLLKVAHHGGNTSTSEAFLNEVNPQYAVISVGKGNKHGHPHPEPLRNLEKKNVTVYRTDEFGTIVAVSDGEAWIFEVSKAR